MSDEYVYIGTPDGPYPLPVGESSPDATAEEAVRLSVGGEVRAFRLVVDPPDDSDHAVRIGLPNGAVGALSRLTATVLEDFEGGEWPDTWVSETEYYTLTTNALTGAYSITTDGAHYQQVGNPTISTPRDQSYSAEVEFSGANANIWLLVNTQDASQPLSDTYALRVDRKTDEVSLYRRENGGATVLDSVSLSPAAGTRYRVVVDVGSDWVRGRLLDAADGSAVASTAKVTDTTFTGGYLGFYTGNGSDVSSRYDAFKQHPLNGV